MNFGERDSGRASDAREASSDQNDWVVHWVTPDDRLMKNEFLNNSGLL
jgi:hypothetical protein